MKNEKIYNKWTEIINDQKYKQYFISREDIWLQSLNQVIKYIDTNNKRPSQHDKDIGIKQLGTWIGTQQKKELLNNKWIEFINNPKYKKFFKSNEDEWYKKLQKVSEYIDINNKRPSTIDVDKQIIQLGSWIGTQQKSYTKKEQIMSNEKIYNKWTDFINNPKYKNFFKIK